MKMIMQMNMKKKMKNENAYGNENANENANEHENDNEHENENGKSTCSIELEKSPYPESDKFRLVPLPPLLGLISIQSYSGAKS